MQILDEIVRKNFSEWTQKLDVQYLKRLEQPLMVRCKDKKLDINFDKWVQSLHAKLCVINLDALQLMVNTLYC